MLRRLLALAAAMTLSAPLAAADSAATEEKLTLGGGCFWCVEAVYEELRGVGAAVSGYSGGTVDKPNYRQVSSGTTGHAEVVEITFDPRVVTRDVVLEVLTKNTGGRREFIVGQSAVETILKSYADALTSQYELTYKRPAGAPPQNVQVGVARPGLKLLATVWPPQ